MFKFDTLGSSCVLAKSAGTLNDVGCLQVTECLDQF